MYAAKRKSRGGGVVGDMVAYQLSGVRVSSTVQSYK